MTISDANPVQFWPSGELTYNETAVCSVEPVFWCQQWECDDPIHIQFTDAAITGDALLHVYDDEGILLNSSKFSEISPNVYDIDFTYNELDICEKEVTLYLVDSAGYTSIEILSNPNFTTDLAGWSQSGSGDVWVQASAKAQSTINGSDLSTKDLVTTAGLNPSPYQYVLRTSITLLGFIGIESIVTVEFFTNVGTVYSKQFSVYDTLTENIELIFTVGDAITTTLGIRVLRADLVVDIGVQVDYIRLGAFAYHGKSDCQLITDCSDCTEGITYSNSNNFDDIDYSDVSPSREFFLRVPATFNDNTDEWPDEHESIDLSDSDSVQLVMEVKHKRLFSVGFVPAYMLGKTQLVLSHDNVTIKGMNWGKWDGMQKEPGNKHYPLRKASFLLTDKDFIKRNVL